MQIYSRLYSMVQIELPNAQVSDPSTALRINCHGLFNQGKNLEPSVATEAS